MSEDLNTNTSDEGNVDGDDDTAELARDWKFSFGDDLLHVDQWWRILVEYQRITGVSSTTLRDMIQRGKLHEDDIVEDLREACHVYRAQSRAIASAICARFAPQGERKSHPFGAFPLGGGLRDS